MSDDIDVEFDRDGATITTLANEEVVCVDPAATLRGAAQLLNSAGVGCVVVCTGSTVEGVVSERDIVRAVADGVDLDATTAADVESKDLKWALPDSTILEVAEEMMEGYVRHVLVGEDHQLVGVVSMRDVLGSLLV